MTDKNNQTSLVIKTDENNKAVPLGIKSTVQGIEHFTNWDNLSNSIDETSNRLRKDAVPFKGVKFNTHHFSDLRTRNSSGYASTLIVKEVDDTWEVNKIKILDDLAFVAEDEYTDVEKVTASISGKAYQYFVERKFSTEYKEGPIVQPGYVAANGYCSWTISGSWASNFEGSTPSGTITVTYTPDTSTWAVSATVPNDGGWGGSLSGTKVQDACSGGGGLTIDVPISGSHYCAPASATQTYSGTIRLQITAYSGGGDGATCCANLGAFSSVGFGTPSSYDSSSGCSLGFSFSGSVYDGFTPPVTVPPITGVGSDPIETIIAKRIGSLTFDLRDSSALGAIYLDSVGSLFDNGESGSRKVTPLSGDYSNLYVKFNINNFGADEAFRDNDGNNFLQGSTYFKFGGIVNNDFSESNIYVRDVHTTPDISTIFGIEFNTAEKLNNLTTGGSNKMGEFLPPNKDVDLSPVNYSLLRAKPYPTWTNIIHDTTLAEGAKGYKDVDDYKNALYGLNIITKEELDDDSFNRFYSGGGFDTDIYTLPLNNKVSPEDFKDDVGTMAYLQPITAPLPGADIIQTRGRNENHWRSGDADEVFLDSDPRGVNYADGNMVSSKGSTERPFPNSPEEGSFGGYYYLIFDDTGEDPKIVGIQFDVTLNNVTVDNSAGIIDGVTNVKDAQLRLKKEEVDASIEFVKFLPVRKCGKVDLYKRKSGIVQSINSHSPIIRSSGHGLKDDDIIEISGALYETAGVGVSDLHPLNGKFTVSSSDVNYFSLNTLDDLKISSLRTTDGITWRSVSNDFEKEGEGWSYQGSLFSPTGRNGYFKSLYNKAGTQIETGVDGNELATQNDFYTTSKIDTSKLSSGIIDFTDPKVSNAYLESKEIKSFTEIDRFNFAITERGKDLSIKKIVDVIPEVSSSMQICDLDNFRGLSLGADQIYPYANTEQSGENYLGSRFGCDLDIKYSHKSGTSKVYTLAVGERGSDVSVNLFGLGSCSFADNDNIIKFSDVRKVIPEYLPYGKTHLINITVDAYNNITSIDHKNSLFGGGDSIKTTISSQDGVERNPWSDMELQFRKTTNSLSIKAVSTFSLSEVLSFEESYLDKYYLYDKSRYWQRHAVMHWDAQNIPNIFTFRGGERFRRSSQVVPDYPNLLKRDFGQMTRPTVEGGKFSEYVSLFGDDKKIKSIDRFNINKGGLRGYWSVFPWVDSFGKSVALQIDASLKSSVDQFSDDDVKMAVLSASTSRSNIDITDEAQQPIANLTKDQIRPGNGRYRVEDSQSQIGQMNAHFVYSTPSQVYNTVDQTQLNAGGSMGGRDRMGLSRRYKSRRIFNPTDPSLIRYTSLPEGSFAGHGIVECMVSCHLSYSDIVFEKDRIMFSEQRLGTGDSIIHVFDFDASATNPFSKNHTIVRNFNFPRDSNFDYYNRNRKLTLSHDSFNVGDGFGSTFKVEEDLLLTNATDVIDEFNQVIIAPTGRSGTISSVAYGIDQIFVYEKFKDVFEFSQKITATTKNNDGGRSFLGRYYRDLTVPLAAMNYDNIPNGTYAWNIDLTGRYDLAGTKIVLQDPYSVAIFDRDFSESEPMVGNSFNRNPNQTSAKIEKFSHQDTSALTYEDASSNVNYDCRINVADYNLERGQHHTLPEQTPILNYNLDGDEDLYISSLKIRFSLKNAIKDISTTFTPELGSRTLVPRVVLYTRDPEGIVTRNRSSNLTSGLSNFYDLDTSLKSKKIGGYIAPERSSTDITDGLTFGAGFMGQYRGGAQDLFFYGTLADTTPVTAQEVFPGGSPRTTLPYLYGGEENLADFSNYCSWIAPDVYHKYNIDQINQIKPYAKIFTPTIESDGSYSVTITSLDLNFQDYISKGNGGIWLGFLLTNVNSFDINTSQITYEELKDGEIKDNSHISYTPVDRSEYSNNMDGNIGPYKYILPSSLNGLSDGSMDMSLWNNARYPYCRVGVYPGVDQQGARTVLKTTKGKGTITKSLSCFAEATVVNPNLEISGFVTTGRRYKTSFSRKAIIELTDISTKNILSGESHIDRERLEESSFSRAVVAISRSSTSANSLDLKTGSFAKSYQVLSSTNGYISEPVSVQTGTYRSRNSNILSSFDIQQPEFLSLTLKGMFLTEQSAALFTPAPSVPATGSVSLVLAPVKLTKEGTTTLFTGLRDFDGVEPLFLRADISENDLTLNITEIQPSAITPLFLNTVDASGGINLAFAPPQTGIAPLFTSGPTVSSGLVTLNLDGSAFMDESSTLNTEGVFMSSGVVGLFTISSISSSGLSTLTMNPPVTGSMPLYIRKDFEASGQTPLTILAKTSGVQGLNLFTGTQYDIDNKDLNLFINSPNPQFNQAALYVDGLSFDANSNRNSNSELLMGLSDVEFDKGDPYGNFNEDPITRTLSSKTYSSNSVLANAIDENFYEHNKKLIRSSTTYQSDKWTPRIFVKEKQIFRTYQTGANTGSLDPAYNLASTNADSLVSKFYQDSTDRGRNSVDQKYIQNEFYDLNDNILIKASAQGGSFNDYLEIGFYDIDDDGNVHQRGNAGRNGVIRFAPANIPLDDGGNIEHGMTIKPDSQVGSVSIFKNAGSSVLDSKISENTIDPFISIRRDIFKKYINDFNANDRSVRLGLARGVNRVYWRGDRYNILDLKISKGNKCAISFQFRSDYYVYTRNIATQRNSRSLLSKQYTGVLIFDINKFNPDTGFSSEKDYNFVILNDEENNLTSKDKKPTSDLSGTSIAWDDSDLYVNTQGPSFGEVIKLESENNYQITKNAIKFDNSNIGTSTQRSTRKTDPDYYTQIGPGRWPNLRYIRESSSGYAKPFFGGKIKIFDEYQSTGKIMLIGAMLFDPYVLQVLSRSHSLNPMGAVYILKKGKDDTDWSYHGAVYAKGYTSENVRSSVSAYRGGYNSTSQTALFGYDFDYSEGVLSVSEPGGDGDSVVNAGKVYTFDISSAPNLLKTLSASDVSVNSSALDYGDNFGTSIVSFGRQDVLTFSDTALDYLSSSKDNLIRSTFRYSGESLIHNMRNNSSFGFGSGSGSILEYSRENTLSELRPYFTSKLKSGVYLEDSSVMQVWSRVLSIKKISTNNKDRLLVVRKFAFRLNSAGMTPADFNENSFDVVKLQVLDLERSANGPLFIKSASVDSNQTSLYNLAPGPSGKAPLVIKPIDYSSELPPLFLSNRNMELGVSLHTPHVDADGNVFVPLTIPTHAPTGVDSVSLFLKHQYEISAPDLFMPVIGAANSGISLSAQGGGGEGYSANPTLVINRHIPGTPENSALGLFLNQKNFNSTTLFGAGGPSNPSVDLVIGTFAIASGVNKVPLSIKTFIPPIGPGGGYIGSGIISIAISGNNDAGVYYKRTGDTTLFMPARSTDNLGGPLFIEKSFGGNSPLYIDSRISSGNVPSYVTGAGIDNDGIGLITKSAETGNFNIFTRGFFD